MQGASELHETGRLNGESHATMSADDRVSTTPEPNLPTTAGAPPGTPELRRVLEVKRALVTLTVSAQAEKARIEAEKREAELEVAILKAAMEAAQARLDARARALETLEIEKEIERVKAELDVAVNCPLDDGA
jgi:hypothetical protein